VKYKALENIFSVNLGVKEREMVLVFTDLEDGAPHEPEPGSLRDIASRIALLGTAFCKVEFMEYKSTGSHGVEPPIHVWEAAFGFDVIRDLTGRGLMEKVLKKEATEAELKETEGVIEEWLTKKPTGRRAGDAGVDAIIAISRYSTSHTKFRGWLTKIRGVRYASMPLFDASMIDGVMGADWTLVKERTERLVELMRGAESVAITTPNGTDIEFSIKGRPLLADTGIITEKGSFSNLPAGEAFLAPLEGTANGKLVLDWAPTRQLTSPVTLKIVDGLAIEATGEDEFSAVINERIGENPLKGNIAELGIGTNDMAKRPDNILETEKILGTIHIAIGDNSTFGGTVSVPFHQDFIFFKPTLIATRNGEKIVVLKEGEPCF
jgi:leucyl aminopeptidase (aminopeptidase T)